MSIGPLQSTIEFISKNKRFALSEVAEATGFDRRRVLRVLEKLRNEGFLIIVKDSLIRPALNEFGPNRRNPQYRVIKNFEERKFVKAPCERDKIWRSLRILNKATISDIVRVTGCKERTVGDYIRMLASKGFLRSRGRRGKEKVWFLINDDGPSRPVFYGQ